MPVDPRFVVLRHEMPSESVRPSHWDLMLEADGVLRTWALTEWPGDSPDGEAERHVVAAESLADHRLHYLEYEGSVASGRGTVARCDQGTYRAIAISAGRWEVDLFGKRLRGRVVIERIAHGWRLEFKKA